MGSRGRSRRAEFLQRIKSPTRPSRGVDDSITDAEIERCRWERLKANGSGSVAPERFCNCVELVIDGQRLPCPKHHSCSYVEARSALVPEAEKIANQRVVVCLASEDGGASQARWVRHFASAMERLSRPLLLNNNGQSGAK